jgi:6-phosphogluconolactonase
VREPGLRDTRIFADVHALSRSAAESLEAAASSAIAARGRFTVALAGGQTPRTLYQLLATEFRSRISWGWWEIFFGDERCVPPYHSASNYGMVASTLLTQVTVPERQVHRIAGELPPEEAAEAYEGELRLALATGTSSPVLDVALLGVGTDGHTASLFPGSPALDERARWVVPVIGPPSLSPRERITLTLPVLNVAREVYFLCAGEEKRAVVSEILSGSEVGRQYPAGRVRGAVRTVWFLDEAAGAEVLRDDATIPSPRNQ